MTASAQIGPRESMLGVPLAPIRPVLAAAQRDGEVNPDQVQVIVKALTSVDRRGLDAADIDAGEEILTNSARRLGPVDLARLATRVVDAIDPDGSLPDDQLQQDRRSLELRHGRDGSWIGRFRLTGVCGAKLAAILGPLAKPQSSPTGLDTSHSDPGAHTPAGSIELGAGDDPAGGDPALGGWVPAGEAGLFPPDPRSSGQRMHDALEEVCDRILRGGSLPDAGGIPATVIITIAAGDLRGGTGHGTTSDGTILPADQVREAAEAADVWTATLSPAGALLELGHTRRIATLAQTIALIARDGGCSFPGCDHPPEWCERHHILEWINGGRTDLDNLTLLCRYHHRHFERLGWRCRLNPDRLTEWIPPAWLDPHQQPRINSRIQAMHGRLVV